MSQTHDAHLPRRKLDIEAMKVRITTAPPPEKKLTRREAFEALKVSLQQRLADGHTPASLSTLLRADGLVIGARTLATWLNVSDGSSAKARARKRSKPPAAAT